MSCITRRDKHHIKKLQLDIELLNQQNELLIQQQEGFNRRKTKNEEKIKDLHDKIKNLQNDSLSRIDALYNKLHVSYLMHDYENMNNICCLRENYHEQHVKIYIDKDYLKKLESDNKTINKQCLFLHKQKNKYKRYNTQKTKDNNYIKACCNNILQLQNTINKLCDNINNLYKPTNKKLQQRIILLKNKNETLEQKIIKSSILRLRNENETLKQKITELETKIQYIKKSN